MYTNEELKQMTINSLCKAFDEIINDYSYIYDEYHNNPNAERDVYFLHDLVDAIKGIEAVLEVYTRDKHIHPGYACEKLHWSYSNIKYIHDYFENKLKKENDNE